ncbi:MAG: hypothetical protein RIR59_627, partial [Pseudomonadota bacterium]
GPVQRCIKKLLHALHDAIGQFARDGNFWSGGSIWNGHGFTAKTGWTKLQAQVEDGPCFWLRTHMIFGTPQ